MTVILKKTRHMRKHLPSAPTRVEKLSHSQHRRDAPSDHVCERGHSAKHWVRIWQGDPTIRQFLAVENIECLKYACKQGNPRQSVLIKYPPARFLQFVIGAIRNAAKQ